MFGVRMETFASSKSAGHRFKSDRGNFGSFESNMFRGAVVQMA